MSTKLPSYLFPKGRSASEPDLMPNVLDSDGNPVLFTSPKRKTTEGTVVDLGDSPNSNNGDPLRTAFAKINNFIEATYWWDEGINNKFKDLDSEIRDGLFIYTDSDQRASLSLSNNSKLYFRGTPNQIELNITRTESPNNPYDFDSEVSINFQLTETVDISTLNVKEHATFDSDITVTGKLIANSMEINSATTLSGTTKFSGNVEFFDSENHARMVWDKDHATLTILYENGSEAFKFNADTGQLTGDGTIDAGFF